MTCPTKFAPKVSEHMLKFYMDHKDLLIENQLTRSVYKNMEKSACIRKLKEEILAEHQLVVTEQQMKTHYQNRKSALFATEKKFKKVLEERGSFNNDSQMIVELMRPHFSKTEMDLYEILLEVRENQMSPHDWMHETSSRKRPSTDSDVTEPSSKKAHLEMQDENRDRSPQAQLSSKSAPDDIEILSYKSVKDIYKDLQEREMEYANLAAKATTLLMNMAPCLRETYNMIAEPSLPGETADACEALRSFFSDMVNANQQC